MTRPSSRSRKHYRTRSSHYHHVQALAAMIPWRVDASRMYSSGLCAVTPSRVNTPLHPGLPAPSRSILLHAYPSLVSSSRPSVGSSISDAARQVSRLSRPTINDSSSASKLGGLRSTVHACGSVCVLLFSVLCCQRRSFNESAVPCFNESAVPCFIESAVPCLVR